MPTHHFWWTSNKCYITAQGQKLQVGDVFNVDQADIGGTGSGFTYTLQSQSTGITSVTGYFIKW